MPAPANTVTTLLMVGQAEDVEDIIYRVSPEETPFTSNIDTIKASARYHEWQIENLATPINNNAQLEGDDYAAAAGNYTTRIGNYCAISAKAFTVSRTADKVRTYGRENETDRLKFLRGLELKRDVEFNSISNVASRNEAGANPRLSAGALAFLTTNDSRGASGADGGFSAGIVAAATNGTQRAFTETLLRTVMANLFSARGGGATRGYQAYMSGAHKQTASTFTGIAAIRSEVKSNMMATIYGAADVYQSDFGKIALIPHPYGLTRDVFVADPNMWAIAVLDGTKTKMLGATGDSEKYLMTKEWTLVSRNERASAVIADLL